MGVTCLSISSELNTCLLYTLSTDRPVHHKWIQSINSNTLHHLYHFKVYTVQSNKQSTLLYNAMCHKVHFLHTECEIPYLHSAFTHTTKYCWIPWAPTDIIYCFLCMHQTHFKWHHVTHYYIQIRYYTSIIMLQTKCYVCSTHCPLNIITTIPGCFIKVYCIHLIVQ